MVLWVVKNALMVKKITKVEKYLTTS